MKYVRVYASWAIDEVLSGHTVYCCDRIEKKVHCLNTMNLADVGKLIKRAEENCTAFELWYELEGEDV